VLRTKPHSERGPIICVVHSMIHLNPTENFLLECAVEEVKNIKQLDSHSIINRNYKAKRKKKGRMLNQMLFKLRSNTLFIDNLSWFYCDTPTPTVEIRFGKNTLVVVIVSKCVLETT